MKEDIENILKGFEESLIQNMKDDSFTSALKKTERNMVRLKIISVNTKSFHNSAGTRGHPRKLGPNLNASWAYDSRSGQAVSTEEITYFIYDPKSSMPIYHEIKIDIDVK